MKQITLFGHPPHPAFVHLPLGVLPLVVVWDGVALIDGGAVWWALGFWCAVAGVAGALLTVATGFLDYLALPDDPRVMRRANRHIVVMASALVLVLLRILLQGAPGPPVRTPGLVLCLCSALGAAVLLVGGWLGGELVYGTAEPGDAGNG